MRPAGQFPGDGAVCKPHVQGVSPAQSIQGQHSLDKPERLAVVCIKPQLSLMKADYVSGTELGMLPPFTLNLPNRLCKAGGTIPVLQTRRPKGGEETGLAKLTKLTS